MLQSLFWMILIALIPVLITILPFSREWLGWLLGAGSATGLAIFSWLKNYRRIGDAKEKQALAQEKIGRLTYRLIQSQEKEREWVGKELHDGVGQVLAAALINLNSYKKDKHRYKSRLDNALDLIHRASRELREIYTGLFPSMLADIGLKSTIEWYAQYLLKPKQIFYKLDIRITDKLPYELEVNLYRIIQELFSNTLKYSNANQVKMQMQQTPKLLKMNYRDNGVGFNPNEQKEESGFGLSNINTRVLDFHGEFRVDSALGKGIRVMITIPLKPEQL